MSQLVNPRCLLRVLGETNREFTYEHMDFNIDKDLDEEPNTADITIYNLKEETRKFLKNAANQSAPVEFFATPHGVDTLSRVYRGELDTCNSRNTHPGHETELHCISQQINHRQRYVERTFSKGTPIREILNYFIDGDGSTNDDGVEYTGIGLPHGQMDTFPSTGILLSQTFSGPAFPLLKRYAFDIGMYAYILDGTINVTSIYEPGSPRVIEIPTKVLLATPEENSRSDAIAIEQKTIVEATGSDPFEKASRKPKKKRKVKVPLNKGESIYVTLPEPEPYSDDYTEYEAVDTTVTGVEFRCLLQNIDPDCIVRTPMLPNRLFRVIEVNLEGNNYSFDDWTTTLQTDEYEDQTGELVV